VYPLKYQLYLIPLLSSILLLASCAQIIAPSGGSRDTTPPVVEKEYPPNKSTSFSAKVITLKFDEFIQLKDADDQVVISPPMLEKPILEVSGKSINMIIRSELKPNTTYTVNFGNSITDNHENNILANYHYVFSTGTLIDTLTVKGSIHNGFNASIEKGILVCLYPLDSFSDSTIIKTKPLYFSKSTENGHFLIENLPSQSYQLVAFKDENKNLKYDQNEVIAFADSVVHTDDSLPINLYSFKPNPYPINKLIDTISKDLGQFKFAIYKPTKLSIKPKHITSYHNWFQEGKDHIDTITLFSANWQTDSVYFNYSYPTRDTIFYVKPKKTAKYTKFETPIQKTLELNDSFTIRFNQPIENILLDTPFLVLKEDSNIVQPKVIISPKRDYVNLYYPLKESTKYSLEISDSAVTNIYGLYNKKEKASFTTKSLKDYSSLVLDFVYPQDGFQYIAQLVTEDEKTIFKTFILNADQHISMEYLIPAKYKVKIIRDTNRNGIWDNGDYQLKTQPEKVFYYSEILTLRAFWDLQQTIDLNNIVD
jgi:uncharacterized protein (DUF2141 family)